MLQWPVQRDATRRGGADPIKPVSVRLSLQPDPMKAESLVIADQQRRGEYVPGLVHTARQVTKVGSTRSRWPNLWGAVEGETRDWD